jgi:hypothetical protein
MAAASRMGSARFMGGSSNHIVRAAFCGQDVEEKGGLFPHKKIF